MRHAAPAWVTVAMLSFNEIFVCRGVPAGFGAI
jgi:hypothetical protein